MSDAHPAPLIVLYDGHCSFCTRSARGLQRRFGERRVRAVDLHQPGVLDGQPPAVRDAAMTKMHVILPSGRVVAGAEAAARIAAGVPIVGWLAYLYYVPGLRQLMERAYGLVAKNRYRLFGRTRPCDSGSCSVGQ
jgi:predicted DCC family thiol-disulfide oxidoreductase YuxK